MRSKTRALALFAALLATPALSQTTWYVDGNAPPPGNGSAANPYQSIQFAISQATTLTGDTLLVLPGTYTEKLDYQGKSIGIRSTAGPAATHIAGTAFDLASLVTVQSGEGAGTVLEGFTLRDGRGFQTGLSTVGGAVRCWSSQLTLKACILRENGAQNGVFGGAIHCSSAIVNIQDCQFVFNGFGGGSSAAAQGGALFSEGSLVFILRSTFENNGCNQDGGAFHIVGGQLTLEHSVVRNSYSVGGEGAGIFAENGADVVARHSVFHKNSTGDGSGGGMYLLNSSLDMSVCAVTSNYAGAGPSNPHRGGGLFLNGGTLTVTDTLLSDNSSAGGAGAYVGAGTGSFLRCRFEYNQADAGQSLDGFGAGLLAHSSTVARECVFFGNFCQSSGPGGCGGAGASGATLEHCVLVGNSLAGVAPPYEGAAAANCTLRNCIVWDNSNANAVSILDATCVASYSDVQGGFVGQGNLNLNPQFWNAAALDFHLQASSPCINAGDPADPLDPDGSIADMGAYAFSASYNGRAIVFCTAKQNSLGCTPKIGSNGAAASLAGGAFMTFATRILNDTSGLFFWGMGPASIPFQGATLCVQPPLVRTPVQQAGGFCNSGPGTCPTASNCSGTFWFFWTTSYLQGQGLSAGQQIATQVWSRDPADPFATGLTDAVLIPIVP